MVVPYPGTNPSQAWAIELVDAVNSVTGYQQWRGALPSAIGALTAGNYRSIKPSTAVDYTGDGTPDLVMSWTGDCFTPPNEGHYEVQLKAGFEPDGSGSGNRQVLLAKNPTGNTLNSATAPPTWLEQHKFNVGAGYTATGMVIWRGWLTTTDRVMCVVRSTASIGVSADPYDTSLSVSFLRSAR